MLGSRKHLSMVREFSALYQAESTTRASSTSSLASRSKQIHERALTRATAYRISEADLIESLREVDDDKTFEIFECTSLYQYSVKCLKLSEDVSCSLISIMRKSRKVPELTEAIRDGSLTASMAKKIAPVINEFNKDHWLKLASTSTYKAVEQAVATENPKLAVTESIKYKTADRLELRLGVSEDWLEKLKLVKDLLSQKESRAVTTEEALLTAMEMLIDRIDPLEKAKRAEDRRKRANTKKPDKQHERTHRTTQTEKPVHANQFDSAVQSDQVMYCIQFESAVQSDQVMHANQVDSAVQLDQVADAGHVGGADQVDRVVEPRQTAQPKFSSETLVQDGSNLSVARRIKNDSRAVIESTRSGLFSKDAKIETTGDAASDFKTRKPLTAALKHFVILRDQRRCTHRFSDGSRCEEKRWLDVHHILPLSEGGADEPDNLATLCSRHHACHHRD